ncbi:MAG: HAD family hydrolase [Candidatus Cloacimonetes bacterium]|nr:HAD family hydrolase [Candidatus Cloacimonadota bacterium]
MKAMFLDRDGTINHDDHGYIKSLTGFRLFDFTATAIKIFNELDYKTIVVSNQAGVAKGFYTIPEVDAVNRYMCEQLEKENAFLDMILYSPYHPEGSVPPYNVPHISRKPLPGMFFTALHTFPIKASLSYMIGDKDTDIEFGKKVGLTTILVKTGNGADTWNNRKSCKVMPDFVVENLLSAAILIKTHLQTK